MKIATVTLSRKVFRIALAVVVAASLGVLIWVDLKFGDALVGKIAVNNDTQILATIDIGKLEKLETQRQERLNKPYQLEINNPFLATPKTPPKLVP
jgi:hypothetical protein